jgi:hypothetical protein
VVKPMSDTSERKTNPSLDKLGLTSSEQVLYLKILDRSFCIGGGGFIIAIMMGGILPLLCLFLLNLALIAWSLLATNLKLIEKSMIVKPHIEAKWIAGYLVSWAVLFQGSDFMKSYSVNLRAFILTYPFLAICIFSGLVGVAASRTSSKSQN